MAFPETLISRIQAAFKTLGRTPCHANGDWEDGEETVNGRVYTCSPLLAVAMTQLGVKPQSKPHATAIVDAFWSNGMAREAFRAGWRAQGYMPLEVYPWRARYGRCSVWYDAAVELRRALDSAKKTRNTMSMAS
jgi:hypothetical protein